MTDLAKVQKKKRKINVAGYLFILPAMLFFCLYILYPIFFIVKNSLLKWATLSNMEFVGLENFIKVFQDSTFWVTMKNSILWIVVTVPVQAILGFFLAGIGVGIGAFMTLVYTPSVTTTTAGDIGMNIMVAIVFGGMPISGCARSKIYAAVVGGFSYIVLNNILDLLIESTSGYGITQIISAVFFLVVVYVASVNYRSEMLPR